MTKSTKTKQTVSVQQEVEAIFLTGTKPLPENLAKLRAEYNQLNKEIAEAEARKTVIKSIVGLQADLDGVSMYTENGVDVFGFNSRETVSVDRKKLEEEFPKAFKAVVSTSKGTTFYSKK